MQGDQAWATTLVAFDTASGNSISLAVPTKTDENRYLSTAVARFVKQMAYPKCKLRTDPEGVAAQVADRAASRCALDAITAMLEKGPRFSSQSLGAIGRHQQTLEDQIRTLGSRARRSSGSRSARSWTFGLGWSGTRIG